MKKLVCFSIMLFGLLCAAGAQGTLVTQKGVGPIRLLMSGDDIPAKVDGLYDRVALENFEWKFYKGSTLVMKADMDLNGMEIYEGANVYLNLAGKKLRMGNSYKGLKTMKNAINFSRQGALAIIFDEGSDRWEITLYSATGSDNKTFTDVIKKIQLHYYDMKERE